ncbi:hypothetical protein RDI58_011046 [Solanum bulbocastanum]|uniref:Uncharacterized protein n=1 Tax=Solanum bulbocastanum TaxID=147425 RepID=A0AAN8YGK3_SOLBU
MDGMEEVQEKNSGLIIVVEDESNMVRPYAIQMDNQVEICNIREENLNLDDLDDTINKVAIEGNMSPKQIDKMKINLGKQKKKGP